MLRETRRARSAPPLCQEHERRSGVSTFYNLAWDAIKYSKALVSKHKGLAWFPNGRYFRVVRVSIYRSLVNLF